MAKTHLITGAGSGIGAALARLLHERGDQLILIARNEKRAEELRQSYPGAGVVVADLAVPEALGRSIQAQQLPAELDSLIHAAGVVQLGSVAELEAQDWQTQLNVNLLAPALLSRIAMPAIRRGRGQVIFVNSGAGLRSHPQWAAYAASKHGLKALADSLRAEEAGSGVRVSSVYPGRTATAMQERIHEMEGTAYDPDAFIQAQTVAIAITNLLDTPSDADITDISIRPSA